MAQFVHFPMAQMSTNVTRVYSLTPKDIMGHSELFWAGNLAVFSSNLYLLSLFCMKHWNNPI